MPSNLSGDDSSFVLVNFSVFTEREVIERASTLLDAVEPSFAHPAHVPILPMYDAESEPIVVLLPKGNGRV